MAAHFSRGFRALRSLSAEGPEAVRRPRVAAFGVLAQLLRLLCVPHRLGAETNAAALGIDFQHDDVDARAHRKGLDDIGFLRDAGLADRDEPGAPGREEHEHAEVLVPLDRSRQAGARHDLGPSRRRLSGARRAFGQQRDADPLLLEVDAQDLERPRHPGCDLAGPAVRAGRSARTWRRAPVLRSRARARRTLRIRRGGSRGRCAPDRPRK